MEDKQIVELYFERSESAIPDFKSVGVRDGKRYDCREACKN